MEHYRYFQHKECEYFPCHKGADRDNFSCLFCYCPLYALGENCGGSFTYLPNGIKDCSHCLVPHKKENYDKINERFAEVAEIAKKK
ncbi:MAG: cysteine-rich small domain-containing protein [Oscillospiraceae bacterium]|nr:cysteine-rich small domain-containing protein [Oscillospiraceae bacterium]